MGAVMGVLTVVQEELRKVAHGKAMIMEVLYLA